MAEVVFAAYRVDRDKVTGETLAEPVSRLDAGEPVLPLVVIAGIRVFVLDFPTVLFSFEL